MGDNVLAHGRAVACGGAPALRCALAMNRDPESFRAPEPRARAPREVPEGGAPAGSTGRARTLPAPVFPVMLAVLLAIAIVSAFVPTRAVEGLPADPSAHAARDLLYGRVAPAAGDLRFASVFFGDSAAPELAGAADPALLERARMLLDRAREAHPFEPRVVAALGHLELARRRLARAERLYLDAIDLRSHCTEARLGLGVALSVEADGTADLFARRALQLQALAQFFAIGPGSEREREALYDRALLEERVGRHRDALQSARAFLALEPASPWADRLRRAIAAPPAGSGSGVTGAPGRSSSDNP
jgi:tetratricopeptide (TPR) repeat protein